MQQHHHRPHFQAEPEPSPFGAALGRYVAAAGLSPQAFARLIGMPFEALRSVYFGDVKPPVAQLRGWARVLRLNTLEERDLTELALRELLQLAE